MKFLWIIIIALISISYYFISAKWGNISLWLSIALFWWDMGMFNKIYFYNGKIESMEIFFKKYNGEYILLGKEFEKIEKIIRKDNNEIFGCFIIVYEPVTTSNNTTCNAAIGVYRRNINTLKTKSQEQIINNWIINNFQRKIIKESACLYSKFPVENNIISKLIGIDKCKTAFEKNYINDDAFKKEYCLDNKWIKYISFDVFNGNEMVFNIPIENYDDYIIS